MNAIKAKYGYWCLIAGAAEGLGEAYAEALAMRGMNLLLVDHKKDAMNQLSHRLETQYGIRTQRMLLDLGKDGAVKAMMKEIEDTSCRLIIYNAAYSKIKRFEENSQSDLESYLNVNIIAPFRLVHAFIKLHSNNFYERKGIVLMSSLAGSWGTRFLAAYGATKAFNRILAEALHNELKPSNIDVMACVAGATATPAYLGTNPQYSRIKPHVMKPEDVAEEVLLNLGRKAVFIPGFRNRMTFFLLNRVLPRGLAVRMFNRTVGRMYGRSLISPVGR